MPPSCSMRRVLVGCLVLGAALEARAQVSVLDPFLLRGHATIGSGGVRRPLREVGATLVRVSGSTRLPPARPINVVLDDPSTPAPHDAFYFVTLPRTENGPLFTYAWGENADEPLVRIEYQQGKTFLDTPPAVTAPAPPALERTVDLAYDDLCSLRVTAIAFDAEEGPTSLDFQVMGPDQVTGARFAAVAPAPTSDPSASGGFVRSFVNGMRALTGEVLVRRGFDYGVRGTLGIEGKEPRTFVGAVTVDDANCALAQVSERPQPRPGAGGPPSGNPQQGIIQGSVWLRRDPADVAANQGPRTQRARYVAKAQRFERSFVADMLRVDDNPIPFSIAVPADVYWNAGSTISLAWPDGRLGEFQLPAAPGSAWSPLLPIPTPATGHTGLYRDGTIIVSDGEVELATFSADMAFLRTTLDFGGCVPPASLAFGVGAIDGTDSGPGPSFVDEEGHARSALTGVLGARAAGTFVASSRLLEVVAIPGSWKEGTYSLKLQHAAPTGDAVDDLDADLQLAFDDNPSRYQLRGGRANQLSVQRNVPLGAATVTMRVRNPDGSLRPFLAPTLTVDATPFRLADDTAGHYTLRTRGSGAALREHRVVVVGPASTATVRIDADVPLNPDGSGGLTRTAFPPITDLPILPPKQDGSCRALCADLSTGRLYEDDRQPPQLTVAPLPDVTDQPDVLVAGTALDGSPPASVTVGVLHAPLSGSTEDTRRSFSVRVPLAPGDNRIEIVATDACGQTTRQELRVRRKVNQPPVAESIDEITVRVGETVSIPISATDPDGDALRFEVSGISPSVTSGPVLRDGTIVWTPNSADVGDYVLTWAVSDGVLRTTRTVRVHVRPENKPPLIDRVGGQRPPRDGVLSYVVDEGQLFDLEIAARDPEGKPLTYALASESDALPAGLQFDPDTGRVRWTPDFEQAGSYRLQITVRDVEGAEAKLTILVEVRNVNRPPQIEPISPQRVKEGESLHLVVHAIDPDAGARLSFTVRTAGPLPRGVVLSLDSNGQVIDWTPDFDQAGHYELVVQVFDDVGASAELPLPIDVDNVNRAPVFAPVAAQRSDGNPGGFTWSVTDPDGDPLVCEARALPEGATFDAEKCSVRWESGLWSEGWLHAAITCSDGDLTSALDVPIDSRLFDVAGGCDCGSATVSGLALLGLLARRRRTT